MRISIVLTLSLGVIVSLPAADTTGTWKLDMSKSKLAANNDITAETLNVVETSPGVLRVTVDYNVNTGEKRHQEIVRYKDGHEHPVEGVNVPSGYSETWQEIDSHQTTITTRKGGKVVSELDITQSQDGRTMTVNHKGVTDKGEAYQELLVLQKQ